MSESYTDDIDSCRGGDVSIRIFERSTGGKVKLMLHKNGINFIVSKKKLKWGASCIDDNCCDGSCISNKDGTRFIKTTSLIKPFEELRDPEEYVNKLITIKESENIVAIVLNGSETIEAEFDPDGPLCNCNRLCDKDPKRKCLPRCQIGQISDCQIIHASNGRDPVSVCSPSS